MSATDRQSDAERHLQLDVVRCSAGVRVALFEGVAQGRVEARGFELTQVDFEEVERIGADLRFLLTRANLFGEMGGAATGEIERLALLLFDELMPPGIKPRLRHGGGSLTLRLDETLQHVPWEVLHTGEGYLARAFAMSRELLLQGIQPVPLTRPRGSQQRVLILADPRDDLPASRREGMLLTEALGARVDVALGFKGAPIPRSYLRENLREYDIIHFAGHAEWDDDGGGWLLEDGRFEPADLRRLVGGRPMPALVFANACSSGSAARPDQDHMARALLSVGVRNVVGTLWDLPDAIGILFAHHFYEALLEGAPIAEAMRRSRCALAARYGEGTVLWGSYVLYGPPQERYFAAAAASAAPLDDGVEDEAVLALAALPADPRVTASPIEPGPMLRSSIAAAAPAASLAAPRYVSRLRRSLLRAALLCGAALLVLLGAWALLSDAPEAAPEAVTPRPLPLRAPLVLRPRSVADLPLAPPLPEAAPTLAPPLQARFRVEGQVLAPGSGDAEHEVVALSSGAVLHTSDRFRVRFQVNGDAHAYLLYLRGSGHAQLLFPVFDGDAGEVAGGVEVNVPEGEAWYWLDDAQGPEVVLLAVSRHPLDSLPTLVRDLLEIVEEATPEPIAPTLLRQVTGGELSPATALTPQPEGLRTLPIEALRARIAREGAEVEVFLIDHQR